MMRKTRPQPKKGSKPPENALTARQARSFRNRVYAHFRARQRSLPWRKTRNPYRILVSEIMLQQTQADRVVQKYAVFIARFPTIRSLARAKLASVLREWQGLGYNRRAKMLRDAARAIVTQHDGRVPKDASALQKLPGIGRYTSRAIAVFAFNQPEMMIETNIRSAHLRHFFAGKKGVRDRQIMPLIEQTLDRRNPRKWYAALMDYGSHLKKTIPNPSRASSHHVKQSPFAGSDRQIRGGVIRELIKKPKQTPKKLSRVLGADPKRVARIINQMQGEGLIRKQNRWFVVG